MTSPVDQSSGASRVASAILAITDMLVPEQRPQNAGEATDAMPDPYGMANTALPRWQPHRCSGESRTPRAILADPALLSPEQPSKFHEVR